MRVGVPKEIKTLEHRVGLTPAAVGEFAARGHKVLIEAGAGAGTGVTDAEYRAAGATIAPDAATVFARAELIVKVKEPQPREVAMLRPGQILFTYLHLAADLKLARSLLKSGVTGIAYETVTAREGGLPLLAPMSEIAGRLAVQAAANALQKHNGGRGVLMGGASGVKPARVVIIGGGVVGTQAVRVAIGLGSEVTLLDRSPVRLRILDDRYDARVRTRYSSTAALAEEIADADAVIGAVLVPGAAAPKLVTRAMLGTMRKGSVLVDVAIDQGGCFETSRPTTHQKPTYVVDGIIHYCVANMPGAVPVTATEALTNAALPYALALADRGLVALADDPHFMNGLNIFAGKVTHRAVAASLGLDYSDPAALIRG